jgi:hypothetical protein
VIGDPPRALAAASRASGERSSRVGVGRPTASVGAAAAGATLVSARAATTIASPRPEVMVKRMAVLLVRAAA